MALDTKPIVAALHIITLLFSLGLHAEEDPLNIQLGEKLFLEDRFSYSFFAKSEGDHNKELTEGDPILYMLELPTGPVKHPQRGQQISCSSCHLVDQASGIVENLVFTYNDFSKRSKVPWRNDGNKRSLRNSMNLVLTSAKEGRPLHWDGEFFNTKDLSCSSLIGRNMGWKNSEAAEARKHIVDTLRRDNGSYRTASDLSESYRKTFLSLGKSMDQMSDSEVFNYTCQLIADYLANIDFSRDEEGNFSGSAYDEFLRLNNIRRQPKVSETSKQYTDYIQSEIFKDRQWRWVQSKDLQYHEHKSLFGPTELRGMRTFFRNNQCSSCHRPPEFTDFSFHSIGISQVEYDAIHGKGSFMNLEIPTWSQRLSEPNKYFTATPQEPERQEVFRKTPIAEEPLFADLGVWNMWGHPDKSHLQAPLKKTLCSGYELASCNSWSNSEYLEKSIGLFRTPSLRSLGQSAPYFHNGNGSEILDVLTMYLATSRLARKGKLRNPDPKLKAVKLKPLQFPVLKAFLESLDEDYD